MYSRDLALIPPRNCLLNASDLIEAGTITFCISVPYFYTANLQYKATARGGKVWIRKEDRVTKLQEHIKNEVKSLGIEIPEGIYCYASNIAFCSSKYDWIINDGTKLRAYDLTNIFKVVEDGLFEGLGIDDSLGVFNSQSKCVLPKEIDCPPHYIAVFLTLYKLRSLNGLKTGA